MATTYQQLDLEGFKRITVEFLKVLDDENLTLEELDQVWKVVSLAYLDFKEVDPSDVPLAVSVLNYASRKYFNKAFELAC